MGCCTLGLVLGCDASCRRWGSPTPTKVKNLLKNLWFGGGFLVWRGGGQGVWHCGRHGEGRGGPVTEWVIDEEYSRMEGGVIQAYVG